MNELIRKINIVWQLIFGVVLGFFLVKLLLYHYHMIVFPYPLEYREGAMLMPTVGMLKGLNHFDLIHQPVYTNIYGIAYPVVVYPFAKVWGATTSVHRSVAAFFALACCLLMWMVLRREKSPLVLNLSAVLLFYALLLFPGTTTACAGPNTLGLFLFLLSIFLPWFFDFSGKGLCLSVILSVVAFFTKPYFVLGAAVLSVYLFLFISKKKGIVYALSVGVVSALSLFVVHNVFETYINNVIFIHINATGISMAHLYDQLQRFWRLHQGILVLLSILMTFFVVGRACYYCVLREGEKGQGRCKLDFIQILKFNEPLLRVPFNLSLFCALCFAMLLYFRFGRSIGAWMWYFFHLLSPFVIIFAFAMFTRYKRWMILFVPFLIFNLNVITVRHDYKRLTADIEEWKNVVTIIGKHKNVLNSPIIATLLIHQGMPVYDSGVSEYFKLGAYRMTIPKWVLPGGNVLLRYYDFYGGLREQLERKEFDLVMITRQNSQLIPGELSQYYKLVGETILPLPHCNLTFTITVWQPK